MHSQVDHQINKKIYYSRNPGNNIWTDLLIRNFYSLNLTFFKNNNHSFEKSPSWKVCSNKLSFIKLLVSKLCLPNFYNFFLCFTYSLYIFYLCKAQNTLMYYYLFLALLYNIWAVYILGKMLDNLICIHIYVFSKSTYQFYSFFIL